MKLWLLLNGSTSADYVSFSSTSEFEFTPPKTGTYWLRFDVNESGKTYTFSDLSIKEKHSSKTVTYDSAYGDLPTPTRDGYTFDGWYKETSYTNKVESTTNVNTASNHTLYAKWTTTYGNITYNYYNTANTYFNTASMYENTGYTINWDNDFLITGIFKLTTRGKRYLIIGNYDASSTKSLSIEVTTANKMRVYIGTGQVDVTSSAVLNQFNTDIYYMFSWDASTKTYTLIASGGSKVTTVAPSTTADKTVYGRWASS